MKPSFLSPQLWISLISWSILISIVMMVAGCDRRLRGSYSHTKSYVPLESIYVDMSPSDPTIILPVLQKFSENNNLAMDDGSFASVRQGSVINVVVWMGRDSFVHAENVKDHQKVEIMLMSHEKKNVWIRRWKALCEFIVRQYGDRRVKIEHLRTAGG